MGGYAVNGTDGSLLVTVSRRILIFLKDSILKLFERRIHDLLGRICILADEYFYRNIGGVFHEYVYIYIWDI